MTVTLTSSMIRNLRTAEKSARDRVGRALSGDQAIPSIS
jgi:hypothetical protein